jgi:hypothetical protein
MDLTASIRAIVHDEIQRTLAPHLSALQQLQRLIGVKPSGRGGRVSLAVVGEGASEGRGRRGESRGCAVIGCPNDAKSKGYCAAHYQKYRMLQKRGQADQFGWSDSPAPHSVQNPTLPRGRAAAKVLAGESAAGKVTRRRSKKS